MHQVDLKDGKTRKQASNIATNTQRRDNDTPKLMLMIIGGVEDEDMGLVAQELPNNFKLLNVPNVVISDSGAT